MEAAVVDFQAFVGPGQTRFIVKEVSIADLDTREEHSYLFKPPRELPGDGRSPSDRWLRNNFHHLEWENGDVEYSLLGQILTSRTRKFKFLYAKGKEKCEFLEELIKRYVYDLALFGCPAIKKLSPASHLKCDRCPNHANTKDYVCAHLQSQVLAKWAQDNKSRIDLRDFEVRLSTFGNWGVSLSPTDLAGQGFIRIPDTLKGVRCVFCGLEVFRVSFNNNPQDEHMKLYPDCVSFKNQ